MATLAERARRFVTQERPAGNLLDEEAVLAQAVAATLFYAGFAALRAHEGEDGGAHEGVNQAASAAHQPDGQTVDGQTVLTTSEWALIRPLFMLYVERETALQLEASRGLDVDPFGRLSGEIAAEISQAEADMPRRAFSQPIITI